jgi:MFS transporter, DHA3 family, multidrug efflux protein
MTNPNLFSHILTNTAVAGFTNMLLWFAITFWAYLTTRSVFVTGMLGGVYLVLNLFGGIWFGSLVDHYRKKNVMLISSVTSLFFYILAFLILISLPESTWWDIGSPWLWIFILVSMLGAVVGNIRMIALSTMVTILIPEWGRDRANGQIGVVNGLTFTVVSVFSGLIIGRLGIEWALMIVLATTLLVIIHLLTLTFPSEPLLDDRHDDDKKVDLKWTIRIIARISGLFAMIFFAMWNNFLGWVFMALMDAYGLSIMSVEVWGLMLAVTSTGFIAGGILISRYGLGKNPVKSLLLVNTILWATCIFFPLVSSIWFVGMGFFAFMLFSPVVEAAEQTILQKVVPLERQGRVFGFSQSVENIASPITAFLVGPLTQFLVMPWVADGGMTRIVWDWWGNTPDRAMAVVFVLAGIIGVIVTLLAFGSRSYREISRSYMKE